MGRRITAEMTQRFSSDSTHPILYSFRRCPYAMRARLAIWVSGLCVVLREVELRQKPLALLDISAKATVPVLQLKTGQVLDESLDIMFWALQQNDPEHWLAPASLKEAQYLIDWNDTEFKGALDRYKYADRYPDYPANYYRQQAELFLAELEQRLTHQDFLCAAHFSLADAAILPFIRQLAAVDDEWFKHCRYNAVKQWLFAFTNSANFMAIMNKYQAWQVDDPITLFYKTA
ncbi:glutathione S-transferase [Methylomonas sp. AM2-LC]|uniref:glutathione S-transferase n=1 Tax=Methylomonas sp. AM2-LC TaxID=3153301 RepID=UPI0032676B4E